MKRLMITAAVLLLSLLQTVCIYAESYEYDASGNMTGTQVYEPEEEKDVLQKIVDAAVQNAENQDEESQNAGSAKKTANPSD